MLEDQPFVHKIAACDVQVDVLEISVLRVLTANAAASPAEASSLKIFATETAQRITELYVELAGRGAMPWPDRHLADWHAIAPGVPGFAAPWTASYLFERAQTIYGGATEIQKNIIWKMLSRSYA
jgi:alkylation response protein AidB-like acyl-CoA dehydrogenase